MTDSTGLEPVPMWSQPVPGQSGRPPLVWLVGTHGGAGVSYLATSISFAGDAGQRWPGMIGLGRGLDSPLVVLVARSHMHGLAALHRALLSHMQGATPAGAHLLGALTVADIDRPLSKTAATRRETVESLAHDLGAVSWRLGWVEPWRTLERHELPAWKPEQTAVRLGERDATRVPPPPVQGLAEQMFVTARTAVTALRKKPRLGDTSEVAAG
ncbi:hypothetical protein [Nocardia yamanashiensis]|uniref:hypothetical protein n=1 Tax=Nocardia yamanashiensis TaxID=209247 RepID=UPI000A7517D5|nr:hypothetical protein [Nocardia yamanashiensis]